MFAAARLLGALCERFGQPGVVGELIAGAVIGPFALGLVPLGDAQRALAEAGAILLLFVVGLETHVSALRAAAAPAARVALLGIVLPFTGGWATAEALGLGAVESLFVGAALVATSVGVTARVLRDLGALERSEARVILGAAVLDDVLGLAILAVIALVGGHGLAAAGAAFGSRRRSRRSRPGSSSVAVARCRGAGTCGAWSGCWSRSSSR